MKTLKQLVSASEGLFAAADSMAESHPWAVVVAMHEYARNLYPSDPYLPFADSDSPTERMDACVRRALSFLEIARALPAYPNPAGSPQAEADEVKARTGRVYGRLWSRFSATAMGDDAARILRERLSVNGIADDFFRAKRGVDIGCGSGRFSIALRLLGCEHVTGVDFGVDGIAQAERFAKERALGSITFRQVNVLELPFADGEFDLVFCNGVLHHTEDMERGLREMARVAAKGARMWLYLYGDGGIFWYARKRMPEVMKKIPQPYTLSVLDHLGMPGNRFIFEDNWYVPIERHCMDAEIRGLLAEAGIAKVRRLEHGRPSDLETGALHGGEEGRVMWGEGELRYVMER
jgi:SAM-dependent methyltransferase